nr:hypothetical protein [Tanacetum cinerariifolium]
MQIISALQARTLLYHGCEGEGFTKETVHIEYERKPPRCEQCKLFGHMDDRFPNNATKVPTVMNNNGFQTVVNKKKSGKTCSTVVRTTCQPANHKVRFEPKLHGNSQKANDGKTVHSASKKKPTKATNVPSSYYTRGSAKDRGI